MTSRSQNTEYLPDDEEAIRTNDEEAIKADDEDSTVDDGAAPDAVDEAEVAKEIARVERNMAKRVSRQLEHYKPGGEYEQQMARDKAESDILSRDEFLKNEEETCRPDYWYDDQEVPEGHKFDGQGNVIYDNRDVGGTWETNPYFRLRTQYPKEIVDLAFRYVSDDPTLPELETIPAITLTKEATKAWRAVFSSPEALADMGSVFVEMLRHVAFTHGRKGFAGNFCAATRNQMAAEVRAAVADEHSRTLNEVLARRIVNEKAGWRAEWEQEFEEEHSRRLAEILTLAPKAPASRKITRVAVTELEEEAIRALAAVKRKLPINAFAGDAKHYKLSFRQFYKKANCQSKGSATPMIHKVESAGWDFVMLEYTDQSVSRYAASDGIPPKDVVMGRMILQTTFATKTIDAPASWTFDPDAPVYVPSGPEEKEDADTGDD